MRYFVIFVLVLFMFLGCQGRFEVIKTFELSVENVIDKHLVTRSSFKDESLLKIVTDSTRTIRLFETGDLDLENCFVRYQAKMKTENLDGVAFLEVFCTIDGKEYFSKALDQKFRGTSDWKSTYVDFYLKKGENPTNIKLNTVAEGNGTILVKSIELLKVDL